MTTHVMLTDDDDDNTIVVRCADQQAAEVLGRSAVLSDGDVSAWLLPTMAINDSDDLRAYLRAGGDVYTLHQLGEDDDRRFSDPSYGMENMPRPTVKFTPITLNQEN